MMELVGGRLDTFQRVLGMAIGSLPITILLGIYGFSTTGIPTSSQMLQGFLLALCSGVIATMTFFFATDLAKIISLCLELLKQHKLEQWSLPCLAKLFS